MRRSLLQARALARRLGLLLLSVTLALGVAGASALAQDPLVGEDFGFADDVAGTAFPGESAFWAGTCDLEDHLVDAAGFGTPPDPDVTDQRPHCIDHGQTNTVIEAQPTWLDSPAGGVVEGAPAWRRDPVSQAGSHPDATVSFWLNRYPLSVPGASGNPVPHGEPKDIVVELPPGLVGDPTAVPFCESELLNSVPTECPPETQIGVATLTLAKPAVPNETYPVYNAEPRDGKTAEFVISGPGIIQPNANVAIVARVRTEEDFGIDALAIQVPAGLPLLGQTITIWGVPWAAEHDVYRPVAGYPGNGSTLGVLDGGLTGGTATVGSVDISQEPQSWEPSWGPITPFMWAPTRCGAGPDDLLVTWIHTLPWQFPFPENTIDEDSPADAAVDGCGDVPFSPSLGVGGTSPVADAPSGLSVDLALPPHPGLPFDPPAPGASQGEIDTYVEDASEYWRTDPARLTPSALKDTVVTLPEGFAVNPSSAAGLEGCTDAQIGLTALGSPPRFDNSDPFDGDASDGVECPDGSKIGTVEVTTPVLDETLSGEVVLGQPKSTVPTSGDMFRLFLVIRNRNRGVIAKVFGSSTADPDTGQLTATFADNPELPLERVQVQLRGGQRGTLRTPQRCGAPGWSGLLTPWSALHGATSPAPAGGAVGVSQRCAYPFSPAVEAGTDNRAGGQSGTFSFTFTRDDGEQWIDSLSAQLPRGLLASLRGVPLCSNAQADAGACPAASRVGTVDAAAGAGIPYFLERKGDAYLTEGYKGAPYGLAVNVPVEAGPFRGPLALEPIFVRQALRVDPATAQVTVESDPFPQIWHGIPLAMRQATVRIDRPDFTRNPTNCRPKQILTTFTSTEGARSTVGERFQATRCSALRFRPRIALRLTGRRQTRTGGHPGVRALVRQPATGQAGIRRAQVRLPLTLALDPDNARGLCEFVDGTKPDLESHCPRASIVGRARAVTPLLDDPLRGNVYFVKNVRVDPRTGNEIRTLPMIVVALRGEIAVNLYGRSSVKGRRLVNTFANVPDAPVSRFNLNIRGGGNGILVVTRSARRLFDLCKAPNVATVAFKAHNNGRLDLDERMNAPCGKKGKRKRANRRRARR